MVQFFLLHSTVVTIHYTVTGITIPSPSVPPPVFPRLHENVSGGRVSKLGDDSLVRTSSLVPATQLTINVTDTLCNAIFRGSENLEQSTCLTAAA